MDPGNSLAMCHNIIDCGFKQNQTEFKIAVYNAKVELLLFLLSRWTTGIFMELSGIKEWVSESLAKSNS